MPILRIADHFDMYADTEMEQYRADTFATKEPETLEWISDISSGDILHDVGANIGIYSLYAASRGLRVFSYEPVIENCMRLQQNADLNGFGNIRAYNVAISGKPAHLENLYMPSNDIGSSGSQVSKPIDEEGKAFAPLKTRSVMALTLWEMLTLEWMRGYVSQDAVHHIKIDVDGHEQDVCDGMRCMLRSGYITSVLVEVNKKSWDIEAANQFFRDMGYTGDNKYNRHPQHSRRRRENTKSRNAENVIYIRTAK